jgi:hypothetical protein
MALVNERYCHLDFAQKQQVSIIYAFFTPIFGGGSGLKRVKESTYFDPEREML